MTTTNAQTEEPFLSGMKREEPTPTWREMRVTVKAAEIFRGDGLLSALIHKIRMAMGMIPDRGPDDYEAGSEYERGMRAGARYGGYHEAPKNENNLKAVIIGCTITLLSAFVIGAWKLSNDSAAIRAEFTEWKTSQTRWMDQIDRRLDRQESRRP